MSGGINEGSYAASYQSVQEAAERIKGKAKVTPVMTCSAVDRLAERQLFFKCENFQKIGAFKFRGAYNAIGKYLEDGGKGPVVTHSSGNHAQAVAKVASMLGLKAYIVMPENSAKVKVDAVLEYGAEIVSCGNDPRERIRVAEETAKAHPGCFLLPSYDHPDVMSGQGTLMLEFLSQVDDAPLDAIIVPVGGGGLLSGCCLAAKGTQCIRIFAAEPKNADDAAQSHRSGTLIEPSSPPNTIADGLRTGLGIHTWPVIRDMVEEVITVSEEEIIEAMRLVYMRMKLVIEPSAAVGVAVALSDRFKSIQGIKRVGVVLCGGNVDIDAFPWLKT